MEPLSAQASDLDSFLQGTSSSTVPLLMPPGGLLGPMAGGGGNPGQQQQQQQRPGEGDFHYAHAHARAQLQSRQSVGSSSSGGGGGGGGQSGGGSTINTSTPYSALHGPNSALPSPTIIATPTSSAIAYAQQQASPQYLGGSNNNLNNNHIITNSGRSRSSHGLSSSPGGPGRASGSTSASAAGAKRRAEASAEDAAQKQQRSKRNRYISIACNECKRRKIKCNGETPCERCGNFSLECLYAPNCCANSFRDSDELKQLTDNVSDLQEQNKDMQEQINALQLKMAALLQQETPRLAPLNDRVLSHATTTPHSGPSPSPSTSSAHRPDIPSFNSAAQFRGPTSATAQVNVARNTLHNVMGYSGAEEHEDSGNMMMGDEAMVLSPAVSSPFRDTPRRSADPLWDFDKDEMIRLCKFHEEEVGIMYPVVNIQDVITHANFLCSFMESARKSGLAAPQYGGQDEGISTIKTLELKIIMCCALVVEGHGSSEKADRMWNSIQPIADKMMMSDPSCVTNLPFLALVAGYRFLANEEVLAWRVMGQVCRLCLEMGLHRRDGIARIQGAQERTNAINTFWSAYVLDRRWSFGTGYPFTVHDDKIDPGLPEPKNQPYLTSLIHLAKLSSKIWNLIDYFEPALIRTLKTEEFEELDREILQWYETVPAQIRIDGLGHERLPIPGTPGYNTERLQIWTRLRLNQIRIWLYTPVLHTHTSMMKNSQYAQLVVNLAKETIQYLSFLNKKSEIYRRIQVFYHHFLISAVAVLFLASTHAPADYSAQCREQFHMALDMVKELSSSSHVSERLWRTVHSLKAYTSRLGLQQDEADPRKRDNAALAMAGRANDMNNSASHRSSVSSGGPQPSPSPGLTPGGHGGSQQYHQQQHLLSRMGSLTPRGNGGGRNSPRSSTGMMHTRLSHGGGEDEKNGLRLQTEMSRLYEDSASGALATGLRQRHGTGGGGGGGGGHEESYTGNTSEYSAGNSSAEFASSEEQPCFFEVLKELYY